MQNMINARLTLLVATSLAASAAWADDLEGLLPYQPKTRVIGTIRTWGHVFVKDAMKNWEDAFRKYHPDVNFEDNLVSSAAAMGGLYARAADIGFIGREVRPMEMAGYKRLMKHPPLCLRVMTGSY